ncbi:MAG TPA: ATP synthase F1 subunit delta [Aquifex aeolicus]|nr:ATP synthase F1 subunit delta [Aquifex aeolicus]
MDRRKDIARRAVRSLLRKLSGDRKALLSAGELLGILTSMQKKNKEVRNFFVSPFVPREKKRELLKKLMERVGVPREALEVFDYLIGINALSVVSDMKRFYEYELEKLTKISKGTLYLARKVSDEEMKEITDTVRRVIGREIELEVSYDEELIGGFLLKVPGLVIDTSVKRQLEKLAGDGG